MPVSAHIAMMSRRRGTIQVSLFLIAFILRLTLFLIASSDEARFIRPDTMTYVRPAINVIDNGSFSASPEEPLEPEFDATPGFPVFIMGVFAIFGRSITMVALMLLIIDSAVPVILFRIGDKWRSWKVGAGAGALYAVSLLPVISCQHVLSDSLFTFFLSLQILFYLRFFRGGRTRDLLIMVIIIGIMTLIRPTASSWIFILTGLLIFVRPLPGNRRLSRILISALIFAAICTPWIARNVHQGAGFRLVTNTAKTVRYYFAAAVEAENTGTSAGKIRNEWKAADLEHFEDNPGLFPDEDSRASYKTEKGMEIIRKNPVVFIKISARPYVLFPAVDAFYEQNTFQYLVDETKKYTPDWIIITPTTEFFIEFKGVLDGATRKKMKLIKKQHPELDIRFVFEQASNKIMKTSKTTYGMWADQWGFPWADNELPKEWLK